MAVPFLVREATIGVTTTTPTTATFSPAPAISNLVVAGYTSDTGGGTPVATTNGNAITKLDTYNSTGNTWTSAFVKRFTGDDSATYSVADTGITFGRLDLEEWANLSMTLDGTPAHTTTATNSQSLGSITTTVPNSVIFVMIGFRTNNGLGFSIDTGFTATLPNQRYQGAYLIAATPGTYSPSCSWTTAIRSTAIMFALKPQDSGSGMLPFMV